MQSEIFPLRGHKVKIFSRNNFQLLDGCIGHQSSAVKYASAKHWVHEDNPQNHTKGKTDTPDYCPEVTTQVVKELEASYNKQLVNDRVSGDLHRTEKYALVIGNAIFSPIQVVTPILNITLHKK